MERNRDIFHLHVNIDFALGSNAIETLHRLTNDAAKVKLAIRDKFKERLEELRVAAKIKRFKDLSEKSYYWDHPEGLLGWNQKSLSLDLVDLTNQGKVPLAYLSFELAIFNDSDICAPDFSQNIMPSAPFSSSDKWEIRLRHGTTKELKTQTNFSCAFEVWLKLPLYPKTILPHPASCTHDYRLHCDPVLPAWLLQWMCRKCGVLAVCSCFRPAIEYSQRVDERWKDGYVWSDSGISFNYIENVCDVCRGVSSTFTRFDQGNARSLFELRYYPYIEKRIFELILAGYSDQDYSYLKREATNQLRVENGFRRIGEGHVSETALFRIVCDLFPNTEVVHHYRADWLDRLEIDIFVPEFRLAIEYQGKQHFEPIKAWGGQEAYERGKERDERKRKLCAENGIQLIEFTYEEPVEITFVRNRLTQYLPPNTPP